MKDDHFENGEGRFESEFNRIRLMNRTLQTENEFLREEIDSMQRQLNSANRTRQDEKMNYGMTQSQQQYRTLEDMETRYQYLEAENRKLKSGLEMKRASPLKPLIKDQESEEVSRLREEVKKLREVIDKLSRGYTSPSKSKSPSPNNSQDSPSKTKNIHDLYYDRQSEESRMAIERQQAMYAWMTS